MEKPKLSTPNQEYRDDLAEELKKTRKKDEDSSKFIVGIKKAFGKDGRSKAEKLLEKEKGTDEYKKAEKERKGAGEEMAEEEVAEEEMNEDGYKKALELDPENKEIKEKLNKIGDKNLKEGFRYQAKGIYERTKNLEKLEELLIWELAVEMEGGGSPGFKLNKLADLYYEKGDFEKAKKNYDRAAKKSIEGLLLGYRGEERFEEFLDSIKEKGIKLSNIPEESYKIALIRGIEGMRKANDTEYIKSLKKTLYEFAKKMGDKINLDEFDEEKGAEIKCLGVIHNKGLGHAERERREALEEAEKIGMSYEKAVNTDWAEYLGVSKERRMDLSFSQENSHSKYKGILTKDGNTGGKFILGEHKNGTIGLFFDSTLGEHRDIAVKYEIEPQGGGWLYIDKNNKKIEVFGKSEFFGKEDRNKTLDLLKKSFEGYEIIST